MERRRKEQSGYGVSWTVDCKKIELAEGFGCWCSEFLGTFVQVDDWASGRIDNQKPGLATGIMLSRNIGLEEVWTAGMVCSWNIGNQYLLT